MLFFSFFYFFSFTISATHQPGLTLGLFQDPETIQQSKLLIHIPQRKVSLNYISIQCQPLSSLLLKNKQTPLSVTFSPKNNAHSCVISLAWSHGVKHEQIMTKFHYSRKKRPVIRLPGVHCKHYFYRKEGKHLFGQNNYVAHARQDKYTMYFQSQKWLPVQKPQHTCLNVFTNAVKSYLSADGMSGSWGGQLGEKTVHGGFAVSSLKDKQGVFGGGGVARWNMESQKSNSLKKKMLLFETPWGLKGTQEEGGGIHINV